MQVPNPARATDQSENIQLNHHSFETIVVGHTPVVVHYDFFNVFWQHLQTNKQKHPRTLRGISTMLTLLVLLEVFIGGDCLAPGADFFCFGMGFAVELFSCQPALVLVAPDVRCESISSKLRTAGASDLCPLVQQTIEPDCQFPDRHSELLNRF